MRGSCKLPHACGQAPALVSAGPIRPAWPRRCLSPALPAKGVNMQSSASQLQQAIDINRVCTWLYLQFLAVIYLCARVNSWHWQDRQWQIHMELLKFWMLLEDKIDWRSSSMIYVSNKYLSNLWYWYASHIRPKCSIAHIQFPTRLVWILSTVSLCQMSQSMRLNLFRSLALTISRSPPVDKKTGEEKSDEHDKWHTRNDCKMQFLKAFAKKLVVNYKPHPKAGLWPNHPTVFGLTMFCLCLWWSYFILLLLQIENSEKKSERIPTLHCDDNTSLPKNF